MVMPIDDKEYIAELEEERNGWQRDTIALREANAGLVKANQEWQDGCLAMQTERDALRQRVEELERASARDAAELRGADDEIKHQAKRAEVAEAKLADAQKVVGMLQEGREDSERSYRALEAENARLRAALTEAASLIQTPASRLSRECAEDKTHDHSLLRVLQVALGVLDSALAPEVK